MGFSILKEGKLVCCTMIGGKITHEPGAGSGTLATFKERRSMGIFKISGIAYWTMNRIEDENNEDDEDDNAGFMRRRKGN